MSKIIAANTAITSARAVFDWKDSDYNNTRALAEKFIVRFADISLAGQGRYWAYAGWLAELIGFPEQED